MTPSAPSPRSPVAAASAAPAVVAEPVAALTRSTQDRVLAGVAAGVSNHLGVPVGWVRGAFVVLGLLAGAGVVAYALLWIFAPQDADVEVDVAAAGIEAQRASGSGGGAAQRRQAIGMAVLGAAVGVVALILGAGQWAGALVGPLVIVSVGAAFIWRAADDAQRQRWRRTAAGFTKPSHAAWWRVAGGVVLVVGGLAVFAVAQVDVASARSAVIAVVLTLVGVAVIAIPWLAKIMRDLTGERRERIRESERAEVAAHLHDSVLQTLALIQRQHADPRAVQRLARAQERDLRSWLYGAAGDLETAEVGSAAEPRSTRGGAAALTLAAGGVEDTYGITIEPVIVGDLPLTEPVAALVAAAREAMVNAAKHSGADEVSVYAEFAPTGTQVFVRDRGRGFDPEQIAADRRGVSDSIRARMSRYGGRATVRSTPESGTEWTLTLAERKPDNV